jgi:hypothetical protein
LAVTILFERTATPRTLLTPTLLFHFLEDDPDGRRFVRRLLLGHPGCPLLELRAVTDTVGYLRPETCHVVTGGESVDDGTGSRFRNVTSGKLIRDSRSVFPDLKPE